MSMSQIVSYILLLAVSVSIASALDPDTETLNTIYGRWGSPEQLLSWAAASGKAACNMTGIRCNSEFNVVSLSLYDIPIDTFDEFLFNLTSLSSIHLVEVSLIGCIPAQITQLTGLQMLEISYNFLTGSLPSFLSMLGSLTALEMNSNQLTGPIPQQLSKLVFLRQLQLGDNMFSGTLPASFSSMTALETFYAPDNHLSGSIPAQYSALQHLDTLLFSSNSLTSSIPAQLTSLQSLSLHVHHNPAMCGDPLVYGTQASTNISKACPHVSGGGSGWTFLAILCIAEVVFVGIPGFCCWYFCCREVKEDDEPTVPQQQAEQISSRQPTNLPVYQPVPSQESTSNEMAHFFKQ